MGARLGRSPKCRAPLRHLEPRRLLADQARESVGPRPGALDQVGSLNVRHRSRTHGDTMAHHRPRPPRPSRPVERIRTTGSGCGRRRGALPGYAGCRRRGPPAHPAAWTRRCGTGVLPSFSSFESPAHKVNSFPFDRPARGDHSIGRSVPPRPRHCLGQAGRPEGSTTGHPHLVSCWVSNPVGGPAGRRRRLAGRAGGACGLELCAGRAGPFGLGWLTGFGEPARIPLASAPAAPAGRPVPWKAPVRASGWVQGSKVWNSPLFAPTALGRGLEPTAQVSPTRPRDLAPPGAAKGETPRRVAGRRVSFRCRAPGEGPIRRSAAAASCWRSGRDRAGWIPARWRRRGPGPGHCRPSTACRTAVPRRAAS